MQNLDTQELLHLAIYAASKEHHDDALGYLKQAQIQEPDNSNAALLLATEYAEIGMYDRAIEKFEETLKLEPSKKIAQLQLSILLISLDELEKAEVQLASLKTLGASTSFGAFALGLQAMINEDLESARQYLIKGCDINTDILPLNDDIQRIIQQIDLRLTHGADLPNDEKDGLESENDSSELLHSTYTH